MEKAGLNMIKKTIYERIQGNRDNIMKHQEGQNLDFKNPNAHSISALGQGLTKRIEEHEQGLTNDKQNDDLDR